MDNVYRESTPGERPATNGLNHDAEVQHRGAAGYYSAFPPAIHEASRARESPGWAG